MEKTSFRICLGGTFFVLVLFAAPMIAGKVYLSHDLAKSRRRERMPVTNLSLHCIYE